MVTIGYSSSMATLSLVAGVLWRLSVQVGDLVKLAKWCKNGPELMQVMEIDAPGDYGFVKALYLGGPEIGSISKVSKGNIFTLEKYDEAMKEHYERR